MKIFFLVLLKPKFYPFPSERIPPGLFASPGHFTSSICIPDFQGCFQVICSPGRMCGYSGLSWYKVFRLLTVFYLGSLHFRVGLLPTTIFIAGYRPRSTNTSPVQNQIIAILTCEFLFLKAQYTSCLTSKLEPHGEGPCYASSLNFFSAFHIFKFSGLIVKSFLYIRGHDNVNWVMLLPSGDWTLAESCQGPLSLMPQFSSTRVLEVLIFGKKTTLDSCLASFFKCCRARRAHFKAFLIS